MWLLLRTQARQLKLLIIYTYIVTYDTATRWIVLYATEVP